MSVSVCELGNSIISPLQVWDKQIKMLRKTFNKSSPFLIWDWALQGNGLFCSERLTTDCSVFNYSRKSTHFCQNSGQENQLRLFSSQWPVPSGNIFNTNYVKYFYDCFAWEGLLENDGSAIRKCWAISRSCWAVCLGNRPGLQTPSQPAWICGFWVRGEVSETEWDTWLSQTGKNEPDLPAQRTPCNGNLIDWLDWLQKMRNQ